jgi:hypothetical protein
MLLVINRSLVGAKSQLAADWSHPGVRGVISKNHLVVLSIWEDLFTKRSKEYCESSGLLSPVIIVIREVMLLSVSN